MVDEATALGTFDVSSTAAWIVLFGVCIFFTLLAVGSMDKFVCLPPQIGGLCLLNKRGEDANTVDYFLSARNSAGFFTIAVSFFASGMGSWVVYATTELGANPAISWLGVLGYSCASGFPAIVVCFLGPHIKEMSSDNAFSTTDFGRERYGRVMQLAISAISLFYMFILMVAELTSVSNVFALMTNEEGNKFFMIAVTVVIGVFTLSYTALAGLPSSIVTDRFQGFIMAFFVLVLTIAVCSFKENKISREEFKLASSWTVDGFFAMVTLFIAILCAELFNQATWQRVWAAESVPALRKGFALGSFLIFLLMSFFGIMGMIAYSKDPVSYDLETKFAYLSFFDLLVPLGNGWHVIVLIFVSALAASSLDSLQNGLNSIFYRDALRAEYNAHTTASVLVLCINIPAIWLASKQISVLALFLVADLVCATAVLPTFLGLQKTDKLCGFLPAPTELGAFMGVLSGISTVPINGYINGFRGWECFQYFWLKNGSICQLCGSATMVTFIVTPLIAGFMTYFFTHLDLCFRGEERARRPIIELAFDKDADDAKVKTVDAEGADDAKVKTVDAEGADDAKVKTVEAEEVAPAVSADLSA